jgi:predicted Rossmann fold flavoprotein
MNTYDVIVLGGGAAGLMCAMTAGQRGRRVLVLDSSNKVGKKILMSGGGRCNFTNLHVGPANFISANPHFCKSALSRYTQWTFLDLVERYGIAYHERKHGQLFCDVSARDILAMLLRECADAGVSIRTDCPIEAIRTIDADAARFEVRTGTDTSVAESLVVATGALSIPKMGASGFGYTIARQFGLQVLPTRAGLVPFVFSNAFGEMCARLSGVSLDCTLTCGAAASSHDRDTATFTEALMFSHRGLTGPAALQLSNYWREGIPIQIDLLPALDVHEFLLQAKTERPRSVLRSVLAEQLPRNLVMELEALLWPERRDTSLAEWTNASLSAQADTLSCWTLRPSGTEGYRTAEVTVAGVDTSELSSKTLQSKRHPGLYFIGEVVDVTGQLGGFNFQWALSSGYAAGSDA